MANQTRTSKYGGKDSDDSHAASNNLWVGNLSIEITDRDLMDLFSRYGPVDSLTSYPSRNYAFVLFKSVEDAKTAKDALQGTSLRGCNLKIYFAKPAKPCRRLWVGGVSSSVTKEELEVEFIKFGKVDEYKFIKERNAAYFEYANLEDASQALKAMSGKLIGGEQIRVDFFRSLSSKRDQGPGFQDHGEGQLLSKSTGPSDTHWNPHVPTRNSSEPAHSGLKRQAPSQPATGRKGDGQPSTVLWVGYPPSLRIDEQMLHNAMILFGEIEGIKVFAERHYAFVEFRSVDEARRAKEGLQGRLFNDSRITILFSCSSLAPGKGSRPPQVDAFGNNRPGVPNNYSGPGILGPPGRPFGSHASYEPLLPGSFNDSGAFYKQDSNPNTARRRQPSSGPGMHNSPGTSPSITRTTSSGWDAFDDSNYQRDSKRSRLDGALPFNGASRTGMGHVYGAGMENNDSKESVAGVRPMGRGNTFGPNDNDFIWRGTIAKGGTLVCHARCLAVGKGIGSDLPAVVNCCARTGLDMLTKHYAEAIGFEIVYFLPDSENDFASYTEFLRYLGSKDRAGVAKLDDGTTLFLVPPSDFLTNVLNVTGPDRLYGVVLRLLPQSPDGSARQQQQQQLSQHLPLPFSQNIDGRYIPEYGLDHPIKVEGVAHVDRNRVLKQGLEFPSKLRLPHTSEPYMAQPAPQDYTSGNSAGTSQAKVTLTPELIATLASLLPSKSSGFDSSQPISATNPDPHDSRMLSQGWKTENQYHEQIDRPLDPQAHHVTQFQSYQTIPNSVHHSPQLGYESSQFQDFRSKPDFASKTNYGPNNDFGFASQSGVSPVPQQVNNPRYEGQVMSQHPQTDYGPVIPGRDATRFYGSTEYQAQHYSNNNNNPINFSRPQDVMMPPAVERASSELSNPVQPVLSGGGQSSSEGGDVDKNQRYQSTLQFAASLLLQIQQQQQQQQLSNQQ